MSFEILIPDETRDRLSTYESSLAEGTQTPGARLRRQLQAKRDEDFATLLFRTKQPRIFAENEVAGDGSDWNGIELSLLGDISVAMDVRIFDDGTHTGPIIHPEPLDGSLVFVPGALLRSSGPAPPADWAELVDAQDRLVEEAYDALYERRLLPGFRWIHRKAEGLNTQALMTLSGLGCGQFAGPFAGQLERHLARAIGRVLEKHAGELSAIRAVLFDPYRDGEVLHKNFKGIDYLVRPLLSGGRPQLAAPGDHASEGEDFSGCRLFSFVAWDHVSWPGNDFFAGARATDDGVKAAATNSMERVTGVPGAYDSRHHAYLPPAPYRTWGEVIRERGIRFPK